MAINVTTFNEGLALTSTDKTFEVSDKLNMADVTDHATIAQSWDRYDDDVATVVSQEHIVHQSGVYLVKA